MTAFWNFFLTHNRFSILVMVALTGAGLYALYDIPKESAPEIQIPVGIVTTILPGASATDVETLVTNKIEQQLSGTLENLDSLTSTSREGASSVVAEFDTDADIDTSIQELKDEIDNVVSELPEDANDPVVSDVNFVDQPIMTIAVSGNRSEAAFATLTESFEDEIEGISGVSRVHAAGIESRELSVVVRQTALLQYDITLDQVVAGIASANRTVPVGSITSDDVRYTVSFEGDITGASELRDVPIAAAGGQPVFVRDIAAVIDAPAKADTISRLSVNGEPSVSAVTFDVYKSRGGDITKITAAITDRLESLAQPGELLDGLTTHVVLDNGELIKEDLTRLTLSGTETVALVVLLLIVAIGWREALVAGAAIPLSFLIGFIGLYATDNTINFISLFALILAVGILVDSAIVMVEGINRRMKENPDIDKVRAARETINEFSTPLIAGTVTTVAMFSGLFLVGGISGEFISGIPYTINFVLFASLLVALGFIPLIASLFLRRRSRTRIEQLQVMYSHKLEVWYRGVLTRLLGDKKKERLFLRSIGAALVIALLLPVTGVVKVIFFEQEDIQWIYAEVELPQGADMDATNLAALRVEEVLYNEPDIASFVTTIGASSAFASGEGGAQDPKYANFFINLDDDRARTSTQIVSDLRTQMQQFRDINVDVGQPNNGPPTGTPIVIRFLGEDLAVLKDTARSAARILSDVPGTTGVTTSAEDSATAFVLTLDRAKAAAFGLTPQQISLALRSAIVGSTATSITTLGDDLDIVVRLDLNPNYATPDETNEITVDTLKSVALVTQNGNSIPLSTVADISLRESSAIINHDERQRVVSLTSNVTADGTVREVIAAFQERLNEMRILPDSVSVSYGGENEESQEAFKDMFIALIVGVVGMLAVLVLQFNSFRHALYVLSILPFSLIGIMGGLALTQSALSFPSIMGFIALTGIVVNNSILLIDQMNENRRRQPSQDAKVSIVDAAVSRLRPILLTATTTVVGVFPLTLASDLWSPLAYAIMFGLAFSVVITLILVPIIYHRKPGNVT